MQSYASVRSDHSYQNESAIVWVPDFDPTKHRYVRETVSRHENRRSGRIRYYNFRVVGWSELRAGIKGRESSGLDYMFTRRFFWLKDYDGAGPYAAGGAPVEGVDPLLIEVGRPGLMTERAWGGPFKKLDKDEHTRWLNRGSIVLLDADGKPIWDTYDAATRRGQRL